MFKKLRGVFNSKKTTEKTPNSDYPELMLLANYDQRINDNIPKQGKGLSKNQKLKELQAYNKKADKQLVELKEADVYLKGGQIEEGLRIYKKIILKEGLYIASQSPIIDYLNHLYKLEKFDEAWKTIDKIALKYPSLEEKYQDFRVKILKKEQKLKVALYHQILAILFINIHFRKKPVYKYKKKYLMILELLKEEEKEDEVQELINKYTDLRKYDQIAIRDELAEIIKG